MEGWREGIKEEERGTGVGPGGEERDKGILKSRRKEGSKIDI